MAPPIPGLRHPAAVRYRRSAGDVLAGILALVTSAFAWGDDRPTKVPARIPYYSELPQIIFADHFTYKLYRC